MDNTGREHSGEKLGTPAASSAEALTLGRFQVHHSDTDASFGLAQTNSVFGTIEQSMPSQCLFIEANHWRSVHF
jgi:hypothetical protein